MIKEMKTLVIFYADDKCRYITENSFDQKNAFDLALSWASSFSDKKTLLLLPENTDESLASFFEPYQKEGKISIKNIRDNTVSSLLEGIKTSLEENQCQTAFYSYADTPFLNREISKKMLEIQEEYKAEYTFADGLPYGFTPELINAGTSSILFQLSKESWAEEGKKEINRTSIFDFLKLDINQFEIETYICDEDLSLLRLNFCTETKLDFLSCLEFYKKALSETDSPSEKSAFISSLSEEEIIRQIQNNPKIYKTLPSYYNIQITSRKNYLPIYEAEELYGEKMDMPLSKIQECLKKISDFSKEAWIAPSFFGEALLHPDFLKFAESLFSIKNLNLLIETDGLCVSEEICQKLKEFSDRQKENKIFWIVRLDAFTAEMYKNLHSGFDGLSRAMEAVSIIEKYFPSAVYPQFVRMKENEEELEKFWRFWSDKNSPSKGNVLVQKYSSLCGRLPDRKSADLSPLERNACYHLRRDMSIFADGSVPLCKERGRNNILGNVFENSLEEIFRKSDQEFNNHLKNKFSCECEKCDEFYTFNF